jgi:Pyruvate/2-oxoglutarate dehydrogenase complex, dihydrolipoamide acyltransferase (E2) component, and related enzymes
MNEIKFVDVGEGITEGHIQKWLVKDGDEVKEDQPVAQIETDKAVVNIPSPTSGKIKINAKENTDVKVGSTLAYVGNADELTKISGAAAENPPSPKEPAEAAPVAKSVAPSAAESGAAREILAAPSVRRLAEQLKVDLSAVTGTGPHGRILENDVRAVVSAAQPKAPYQNIFRNA